MVLRLSQSVLLIYYSDIWDCKASGELHLIFFIQGNTVRHVSAIIIHSGYNAETMQNDIALAILKEPIETSEKINTICVPPPGTDLNNSKCRITSRVTEQHDKVYLKVLEVTTIPKDKCLEILRTTRLGPFFRLHNSFLCAGAENGRNTCEGVGGSPLVCPVPGQPERYAFS